MMRTRLSTSIVRFSHFFWLLTLLAALSGCLSHINDLREAQNHFNTAAMLENQLRLDPMAGDALAISSQANVSYQLSLRMLTDLIAGSSQRLQQENLLGTAYTLKALAEWRLGQYDQAIATAELVKGNKEIKLYPRDQVLMNSLNGMIKNDQAFSHMAAKDYDYANLKRLLISALDDINDKAGDSGSLGLYMATARLSVLKNWADLRGTPKAYTKAAVFSAFDKQKEIQDWCLRANPAWDDFQEALATIQKENADSINAFWAKRLAMPQTCQ